MEKAWTVDCLMRGDNYQPNKLGNYRKLIADTPIFLDTSYFFRYSKKIMNIFLSICLGIITVVLTVALIYFILVLIQLKRTVRQINEEMGKIQTITGKISDLVASFNSPFFKLVGAVVSLGQTIIEDIHRRKTKKQKNQPNQTKEES